jgi:hypothetical protein
MCTVFRLGRMMRRRVNAPAVRAAKHTPWCHSPSDRIALADRFDGRRLA